MNRLSWSDPLKPKGRPGGDGLSFPSIADYICDLMPKRDSLLCRFRHDIGQLPPSRKQGFFIRLLHFSPPKIRPKPVKAKEVLVATFNLLRLLKPVVYRASRHIAQLPVPDQRGFFVDPLLLFFLFSVFFHDPLSKISCSPKNQLAIPLPPRPSVS